MKYGVDVAEYGTATLHTGKDAVKNDVVFLTLTHEYNECESWNFSLDEFREFRKAVGYVWQEVHSDDND
jgi:hypothetical protein